MGSATATPDKNGFQASAWHFAALVAGNIALALGPWLVRLADTGPVSAGFWRLLLPLPVLALLAWRGRSPGPIDGRLVLLCLLAGAFFAVDLASWHVGIERTRLANATLFGNSGSVILMAWGIIAARRAPSGQEGVGVLAALVGAGILLGRSLEISATTFVGDLFCLAAGIFYAFYLLPAQRARAALGPWTVLLLVSLIAAPLLLAIALAAGFSVSAHAEQVLKVSTIPEEAATEQIRKFEPLANYLSKAVGMKVEFTPVSDYPAAVEALANKKVDLVWLGGFTFIQASRRSDGKVIPIA